MTSEGLPLWPISDGVLNVLAKAAAASTVSRHLRGGHRYRRLSRSKWESYSPPLRRTLCESDDTGGLPHALGRMFIFCRTSSIGISIQAQ
jgi:hypothetical protein